MYESFYHIKEGVLYGMVREIKKDKILIKAEDEEKYYDLETIPIDVSVGDYIRAFVKDNKLFFIEKLSREEYEEFKKILKMLSEIK